MSSVRRATEVVQGTLQELHDAGSPSDLVLETTDGKQWRLESGKASAANDRRTRDLIGQQVSLRGRPLADGRTFRWSQIQLDANRGTSDESFTKTLEAFRRFASKTGYFAGDFETDVTQSSVEAWWNGRDEIARQFIPLGHDGMDSLYALWCYDGRKPADAPVVFLSGEGSDNTVLANGLQDFLSLLASNQDLIGMVKHWAGPSETAEASDHKKYVKWLTGRGIEVRDPADIVSDAQAKHPDFDAWVTEQMS
jgi:hypothetical protein